MIPMKNIQRIKKIKDMINIKTQSPVLRLNLQFQDQL
jgi:hypothetical protein